MPSLVCCSECSELIRSREASCPFCGAAQSSGGALAYAAAAVLLGAVPSGCGDSNDDGLDTVGELAYGVPTTFDTDGTTGDSGDAGTSSSTGETETGETEDSGGSSGSSSGSSGSTGETSADTGSTSRGPTTGE